MLRKLVPPLTLVIISILSIFVLILYILFGTYHYLNNQLIPYDLSLPTLVKSFQNGYSLTKNQPLSRYNFLILGLDKRDDSFEKTETTDTILFASLDLSSANLHLISLPRDLWYYPINHKINQIYPLSQNQTEKYSYIKTTFTSLIGQPVDDVLVINTRNLNDIIDILGGVDLYLEKGFKDEQYPNPEYIKNPSKNIPIYKTVEFPSGWVHLDSTNITEFVRSRKSAATAADGGTDLGRINRQQQVLEALLDKVQKQKLYTQPQLILKLYSYWHNHLETTLTDEKIISLGLSLGKNITSFNLKRHQIPIGLSAKDGLIYHPPKFINPQWVFIPADKSYKQLQNFISESINQ